MKEVKKAVEGKEEGKVESVSKKLGWRMEKIATQEQDFIIDQDDKIVDANSALVLIYNELQELKARL